MTPAEAFAAAMRHHQAGQLAEAERLYGQVLAAEPRHLQALTLSGALAMMSGRNETAVALFGRALAISEQPDLHYNIGLAEWALGHRAEATAHWSRAIALNPNFAQAHMNLGNALREEGRAAEAVGHLRNALQLQPSPFAHNNLGVALGALGDPEALQHYRRAIEMHPGFLEPYVNLAIELAAAGQNDQALTCVRRSLQIKETPDNRDLFIRIAASLDAVGEDKDLRLLITRATTEQWGRTNELLPLIATLLRYGSAIEPLMVRAENDVAGADLVGRAQLATVAGEPLLGWMLESAVIPVFALERILTAARALLLDIALAGEDADALLRFACGLARQCYINEYVFAIGADEGARADRLGADLAAALAAGAPVSAFALAVSAAYRPLNAQAAERLLARTLLAKTWPAPLQAVIDQQISEPRAEAACRVTIPRLTAIEDDVSREVRDQYEQNPYPRWISLGRFHKYDSVDALIQREFPQAPLRPQGKSGAFDLLVAGCGTGRQPIGIAQQFERARVLAVDLSSASLGYAKSRTELIGVTNIEYGQADILKLGSIGRSFDVIYSDGVLHHLGDPWRGWRVLLSMLRPNGFMHVSLYSEIARRDVVAARTFIAQRGYGTSLADIRACRQDLMGLDENAAPRRLAEFHDFFTTSECRDFLFHVQEHRMTLPQIKTFLDQNGLRFLGFDLKWRVRQQYAARFPGDKAMIDLDQWDAFERDNPETFFNMYQFWLQKTD